MKPAAHICAAGILLLAAATAACGQGRGGGGGRMGMPGAGMGGGGGMGGGPMNIPRGGMDLPHGGMGGNTPMVHGGPPPNSGGSPTSSMHGGLQLGPPGRWWDDKKFAKSLGLNGEQQKRMDSVFGQNRDALLMRYDTLQKAESRLEALTRSGKPSEAAMFGEIDRVAQAKADLEKAMTHMQLQLRDEMTPEQIGKLDDHR